MLDSESLGGLSLDSGHGSDVSSLASFGSLSSSTSDFNVDHQGATGGQGGARKLLKRVKKSLTFGRSKQDLGTIAEEGRKNTSLGVGSGPGDSGEGHQNNCGRGSDVSSLASFGSLSSSTSDLNVDRQVATGGQGGPRKLLERVKKTLTFGRSRRDLGTIAEEGRQNTPIDSLHPIYVTPEGPLYVLTDRKNRNPVYVMCRQHEMDRDRVNITYCHVTEDGQLINSPPNSRSHQESRRFNAYAGTFSTFPIPLPTSYSSLTHVPPATQYWETEMAVDVKRRLDWWWPVLEVGVVEEDQLESDWWAYNRARSCCVKVGWCHIHEAYCTQVWNQGKHVKCVRDTLSDTPGTSHTLRYGVVIDTARGKLGFVDVDRGVVLEKMDVEFRQTVYPVFGVCPLAGYCTVQMRLASGSDIQMTEDKQKLIYSCLT